MALVMMIPENFEGYIMMQVENAIKTCHLQAILGHPSRKVIKGMVHANLIAIVQWPEKISLMLISSSVKIWQDLVEKQSKKKQSKW